jgi:hypothetical protein
MSHDHLRTLTSSTIIPVLTYGCQLWWGGRYSASNTKRLQTALNGAMRIICRAFRTTPIHALQLYSHTPPIKHTIHRLCLSSSIRLHRLLPDSPVILRIKTKKPGIKLSHRLANSTIKIQHPAQCKSPLQRIAELTLASNNPPLDPTFNAPWSTPFDHHPQLVKIPPPQKDPEERTKYLSNVKNLINHLKKDNKSLVIATDGSRRKTGRHT